METSRKLYPSFLYILIFSNRPPILSNKSWLCWTGVDLGNATYVNCLITPHKPRSVICVILLSFRKNFSYSKCLILFNFFIFTVSLSVQISYTYNCFRHQRLFLLNDSADQSIHFQAMILGEHSDFEVHLVNHLFINLMHDKFCTRSDISVRLKKLSCFQLCSCTIFDAPRAKFRLVENRFKCMCNDTCIEECAMTVALRWTSHWRIRSLSI